jgi:hypothetical protein
MKTESNVAPCECFFLHEAAADAHSPIEFDKELNEFHIKTDNGYSMVYFCPICGGEAPKSLRDDLFSMIPKEEEERILQLNETYKSLEDFASTFGQPDRDQRTLSYKHLSETAQVTIVIRDGEWLGLHATRKQLKKIEPSHPANPRNAGG